MTAMLDDGLSLVKWWAALRAGEPSAVDALEVAKKRTVDDEARLARLIRAEARADHLDKVCLAALGALSKGNHGAAVHVLTNRHDWSPDE